MIWILPAIDIFDDIEKGFQPLDLPGFLPQEASPCLVATVS